MSGRPVTVVSRRTFLIPACQSVLAGGETRQLSPFEVLPWVPSERTEAVELLIGQNHGDSLEEQILTEGALDLGPCPDCTWSDARPLALFSTLLDYKAAVAESSRSSGNLASVRFVA